MEAGGIPQTTNGNVIVSVDQIISKLDTASEENLRLRNALLANNQLLDRKLQQFEPLIAENERELREEGEGGGGRRRALMIGCTFHLQN